MSCTSTRDPSRASTADILFDPGRFEAENARKRSALEYLQQEQRAATEDDLQLQQALEERRSELILAWEELESIHRQIRWIEREIERIGRTKKENHGTLEDLARNESSLKDHRVRQQSLEANVQEIEKAIDALERMIAKRKDMLRSAGE